MNLKGSHLKNPLKRSRNCWRFVKGWVHCNSLKLEKQFGDVHWILGLMIQYICISEKNRWTKKWKQLSQWEAEIRRTKTNSQRKSQSCKSLSSKLMCMNRSCLGLFYCIMQKICNKACRAPILVIFCCKWLICQKFFASPVMACINFTIIIL